MHGWWELRPAAEIGIGETARHPLQNCGHFRVRVANVHDTAAFRDEITGKTEFGEGGDGSPGTTHDEDAGAKQLLESESGFVCQARDRWQPPASIRAGNGSASNRAPVT